MAHNKQWRVAPRIPADVAARLNAFPPLSAQLLYNRGVTDAAAATAFLARDESLLEDPLLLPDMGRAIERVRRAMSDSETVGVFGDFDADGVTGTALLSEGLSSLGLSVVPYIPHRVDEGHGLSFKAVDSLRERGVSLILTVDCGVTSNEEVAYAASLGIDTIITDHHLPSSTPPLALAVVDPKLPGSAYPFPDLAGVGLALKMVQGLCQSLGRPWDQSLLQFAAVGTVTDVTPLVGENRFIVSAGLRSMNEDPRPGLKELLRLAGADGGVADTETIGFILGPRLNAPGRLEHASISYDLLRARTQTEATPLASRLEELNRERQVLTQDALEKMTEQMGQVDGAAPINLLWSEEFAPGIVGLLASRLVDAHYRPAVVVALDGAEARGSARSIPEFNIAHALAECSDLFTRHGGHARAAGFLAPRENLPVLRDRLEAIARRELDHLVLEPTIDVEAHVRLSTLVGDNYRFFQDLAPFGERNPAPVFLTRGVEVTEVRRMGGQGQHLRLKLRHTDAQWDAVAFGQGEGWQDDMGPLDIVYTVGTNHWRGVDSLQLVIEDFRPSVAAS